MRTARSIAVDSRHILSPTFLLWMACLLGIVVLVQMQGRHGLREAFPTEAPAVASPNERLRDQVAALSSWDEQRAAKARELQQAMSDFAPLWARLAVLPGAKGQASAVLQMRLAVDELGHDFATLPWEDSGTNGGSMGKINLFREGLASFHRRSAAQAEKALAEELGQHFVGLLTWAHQVRQIGQRHADVIRHLTEQQSASAPVAVPKAVGRPLVTPTGHLDGAFWTPFLITVLACGGIGCGLLSMRASRTLAGPVAHLVEIAHSITHGRARRRASIAAAGELKELAVAFNQMVDARQQAEERLQAAHSSLELKVGARTAELIRINEALREESKQRIQAQRDFHQAQKMDALGKLAGSIAHDFNNLLTVIIGGAEYVRNQIGPDHPSTSILDIVEQAGQRAAGLTRPLLTFSRSEVLAFEALSLNKAVEEAAQMLGRLLGINVEQKLQLASDLRPVKANATQLQQVLINLGVNARDAMDGIGVLTISTRNLVIPPETLERHAVAAAEFWVELAVSDTGCGMDAATKSHIFEPFFTTKTAGKGTGLGLATVFGITSQSGGFMEVDSEVGAGTTFRVFLPAIDAAEMQVPAEPTALPTGAATGGAEMLLLVDDEEDILELGKMALEDRGYQVLAARDAATAIVLAEEYSGWISVLITDVIMPGMTGVQLAEVLVRKLPLLRVIFASGNSNEEISDETLRSNRASYLQKPYFGDALAAKVREVLDTQKEAEPSK